MGIMQEVLDSTGATEQGWELESEGTYGLDTLLICPHGHTIEQNGRCPEGCISPLRTAGLI